MKKDTEKHHDDKEAKVNQPHGAPIAGQAGKPVGLDTLSHQWQENSPAINSNVVSEYSVPAENVVEKLRLDEEAANKKTEEEKQKPITESEYENRTKLDVNNPLYINPSLDHVKSK